MTHLGHLGSPRESRGDPKKTVTSLDLDVRSNVKVDLWRSKDIPFDLSRRDKHDGTNIIPRPADSLDFPRPAGGGGGVQTSPVYLGSWASYRETEKKLLKARQKKNIAKIPRSIFAPTVNRASNGLKIANFSKNSLQNRTSLQKTIIRSETIISRENPKKKKKNTVKLIKFYI